MRAFLRRFLLWLLVLAMPVQGLAAPLMLHCAQGQERAAHAHGHAAEAAAHAAGHAAHQAAHHADEADAGPSAALTDHSCSACAACCPVLALPAASALPAQPEPGEPQHPSAAAPVPPYLTGGLERPPRDSLA